MARLFHIALRTDWERALHDGAYRVSTLGKRLDDEGFIHLSLAHQLNAAADAFYRGRPRPGPFLTLTRLGLPVQSD